MGLLSWLFDPPATSSSTRTGNAPVVLGTRTLDGRPITRIQRNTQPLYAEKGWQRVGGDLRGSYWAWPRSYEGRIERAFHSDRRFFIFRPPPEVLNGPHSPCFRQRSKGVYEVHWSRGPKDVNAGILGIEQVIAEAFECNGD